MPSTLDSPFDKQRFCATQLLARNPGHYTQILRANGSTPVICAYTGAHTSRRQRKGGYRGHRHADDLSQAR